MISFSADTEKNILMVKLSGNIQKDEMEPAVKVMVECIKLLKDHYSIINDISQIKDIFDGGFQALARILEFIRKQEPKYIIRIVGNSQHNLALFVRFDKLYGHNDVQYVPTLMDALNRVQSNSNSLVSLT